MYNYEILPWHKCPGTEGKLIMLFPIKYYVAINNAVGVYLVISNNIPYILSKNINL